MPELPCDASYRREHHGWVGREGKIMSGLPYDSSYRPEHHERVERQHLRKPCLKT